MKYIHDDYEMKIFYRSENEPSTFDLPSDIRLSFSVINIYGVRVCNIIRFCLIRSLSRDFSIYARDCFDRSVKDQYEAT